MVGQQQTKKRLIEVYILLQPNMRCRLVAILMVSLLLVPAATSQTSGRDQPNCLELNLSQTSNALTIDGGVCVKINLGVLQPGDVYDFDLLIVDDAIDFLLFDQTGILTYDAGQTYRSQINEKGSTENALGNYEFHWKVPSTNSAKTWYAVLDNLVHDGDQGLGDQGGLRSSVAISVTRLTESYWTPYHDVLSVESGEYSTLLSGQDLTLDAGTTIDITAWALEGEADVYLQTKAMNERYQNGEVGSKFIEDIDLRAVSNSASGSWVVPQGLDGEELVVIVDNTDTPAGGGDGTQDIRITVRVELAPVLSPIISSDDGGTVSLGETLVLNANQTPNNSDQLLSFSWDLDASIDTDNDGDLVNDDEQQGTLVSGVWSTIGNKTVTLKAIYRDGQTATTTFVVNVIDTVAPTPKITSNAELFSGGWKTRIGVQIAFSCSSSTDDDAVSSCFWQWGDDKTSTDSSISTTWNDIGTYPVNLTVFDQSGNSDSIQVDVVVDDQTVPVLENLSIEQLPSSAIEGDALKFSISATDAYDQDFQLRYHWDLNPAVDSDQNGDPKDDPDYVGSDVEFELSNPGRADIVVTVFDQSGNEDSHAFSVNVAAQSEPGSIIGILMVVLFVGVITLGIAMIGYRRWQYGIAIELLEGRGLSKQESIQHINSVKQQTKVPIFASAAVIAGLELSENIETSEQKAEKMKQAQYESIYGAGSGTSSQQGSAFAPPQNAVQGMILPPPTSIGQPSAFAPPQQQFSSGSQTAAADAMAMFAEEENQQIIATNSPEENQPPTTRVVSGGISLPHQVKSQIEETTATQKGIPESLLSITCPSCQFGFKIKSPDVSSAVVACPSCNKDFKLKFE